MTDVEVFFYHFSFMAAGHAEVSSPISKRYALSTCNFFPCLHSDGEPYQD